MNSLEQKLIKSFNLQESDLNYITNVVTTIGTKMMMRLYLSHGRPGKAESKNKGNNTKDINFIDMGLPKFKRFRDAVEEYVYTADEEDDWDTNGDII